MSTMTVTLDAGRVVTDPSAASLAHWAYEKHTEACATCRRGDTWCETGRNYLRATQPTSDLPGYSAI